MKRRFFLEQRGFLKDISPPNRPASNIRREELTIRLENKVQTIVTKYIPPSQKPPYPTLFFIPGTAFTARELQFTRMICSHITEQTGWQVITMNPRLAPEASAREIFSDVYHTFQYFIQDKDRALSH